jgi:hypothetical protein
VGNSNSRNQRYIEDVFGRACMAGFFNIRDLERMTMKDSELTAFMDGASRHETVDEITGWKVVAFTKNGETLIYDAVTPSVSVKHRLPCGCMGGSLSELREYAGTPNDQSRWKCRKCGRFYRA